MFRFKSISTEEMSIVVEEPQSLLVRAPLKIDSVQIDGRSDDYDTELGFTPVDIGLKMYLLDNEKLDAVKQWLLGSGVLEYEGRITQARFYNELNPIRTSGIKIFDISLKRSPFWYKSQDEYTQVSIVNQKAVIKNEGTYLSKPIIKITKKTSNSCQLKINGVIFKYNFEHGNHVVIDCIEMNAEEEGMSRNSQLEIGFDFPFLNVGVNDVEILNGDCSLEVKRKDCWI